MKRSLVILAFFVLLISTVGIFAQNDFKMRQRMTMAGRNMESALMIKGSRERSESEMMGMKNVTITECDLKRTIHINDIEKKYFIEPMDNGPVQTVAAPKSTTATTKVKTEKGGFVTRTLEMIDTGERKQMFGLTARHIKTIMTTDPSPDACDKDKQRIETDGWYVDLSVGLTCKFDRPPSNPMSYRGGSSCTDQTKFIQKGTAKLGYAIQMTTHMSMGDDEDDNDPQMAGMMNMSTEILELSRATLPQSLFEIPEGYTEVKSQSELYGKATQKTMGGYVQKNGMGDMMPSGADMPANNAGAKKAGVVRVGVMPVTDSSGKQLSTDMYRSMLVSQIKSDKLEAVAVSSADEAKRLKCDYILNSDVKAIKQSAASKVGGLFGKVTGAPTEGKVEVTVVYDLKPLGADGTTLQMQSTTAKIEGQENSVMMAFGNEAQAVVKVLKK